MSAANFPVSNDNYFQPLMTTVGIKQYVLRPAELSLNWAKYANPSLDPSWSEMHKVVKNTRHVIGVVEFPEKIRRFCVSAKRFYMELGKTESCGERSALVQRVFFDGVALSYPVSDFITLGTGTMLLTCTVELAKSLKILGVVGSSGFLIENLKGSSEKIGHLLNENDCSRWWLNLLKLATLVNGIALSVIGLVAFFFAIVIAQWIFLALMTSSVVLGLGSFFLEKGIQT